ncbi:hypothetical protein D3C81_1778710 [compost metagenome]
MHPRDATLRVDRRRLTVLPGGQFGKLSAGSVFIALRDIDFRQAEQGVNILRFTLQDSVVGRNGRRVIPALLRPVGQR